MINPGASGDFEYGENLMEERPMGRMQQNLIKILGLSGCSVTSRTLPYPTKDMVSSSSYSDDVYAVYQRLGGTCDTFPVNLRYWDVEANGVAIELDEVLHFNRYREITLGSEVYSSLPLFPIEKYTDYCELFELWCLKAGKYGGKWSNISSELRFGISSPPGILAGHGSSRWKQRAFYDFVKDLMPLIAGMRVARISVWDCVQVGGQKTQVGDILNAATPQACPQLVHLIIQRAG